MFNRIIESLKYKINRHLKSNIHTFISAIDLMQPVNGVFTAAQFTAVSRMLDIENIRAGERSEWDVRFANLRQDFSEYLFRRNSADRAVMYLHISWL